MPKPAPVPAPKKTAKAKGPRPKRTGLLARPVNVEIKVDRALKTKWDASVHAIQAAKREGAGAFDVLWETVGAVLDHDPPLYLAGGIASGREFLTKLVGENERTARRLVRVAKYASPAEEAKYGVSKLDAAIAFVEAKAGAPAKGRVPVAFEALRIPVERGGKSLRLPLEDALVEEIAAATRKLLRPHEARPRPTPVVIAVTRSLDDAKIKGVHVSSSRGKVTLSGIPVETFAQVMKTLGRTKLPAQNPPLSAKTP